MDLTIFDKVIFGNRIANYLIALAALCTSLLFVKIVIRAFIKRLKKFAGKTVTTFGDLLITALENVVLPGLYLSCFYLAIMILTMPPAVDKVVNALQLAVVTFFVTRIIIMFLGYTLNIYLSRKQKDATLLRSLEGMFKAIKFLIWVLATIILLDNLGYKVSTIIAGLGIGGIAVAIAAQALLKDFFSYFSIVFDRPFKLGDFIIIGDFMGTVEHIGIKTTRIRSLGGEQVIFSNTDLTDSRVRNYKLMEKRRVLFQIGVTYQTPIGTLKEIPGIIERVITKTKETMFDRAHFFQYGDFSLNFEIVYFVLSPDYNKFMDIQQEINLGIMEEFQKRGIEFAYPTQKLYVSRE